MSHVKQKNSSIHSWNNWTPQQKITPDDAIIVCTGEQFGEIRRRAEEAEAHRNKTLMYPPHFIFSGKGR